MGLLDLPCDGCAEPFPLESKQQGVPSEGYVRNIGGTFSTITVCSSCWNIALEHKCNLDESKDVAKKWKEKAKSWKEERDKKEGPIKAIKRKQELAAHRKQCLEIASKEMIQELTQEATQLSEDVLLPNEKVICAIRSSPTGDRSQLVLTNKNLIILSKGLSGGQGQDTQSFLGTIMAIGRVSVRIYPISEIRSIEIQPLQGTSVGHFQVLTNATSENDNESKFLFDTDIGYYKSILLYRKIRQIQSVISAQQMMPQSPPAVPQRKVANMSGHIQVQS